MLSRVSCRLYVMSYVMYKGMILKDDPCLEEKHLNYHSLSNGIISQDEKSPLVIIPGL